jgi:pyruvate dehydrogenase complex dehydrogenase (E1) component
MGEVVDGQYQKYTVESGEYAREHFFNHALSAGDGLQPE